MNVIKEMKTDLRPKIHFSAKKNWLNDPNGFSYYNGKYHLFFQYNPKGITWGNMSWGHAVSDDLVHWTELGVVLLPDQPYDKDGVFSGSAVTMGKEHFIYYTGVDIVNEGARQVQCLASSKDGVRYEKYRNNPILEADEAGNAFDFRDPKMWFKGNELYMIVATRKNGCGKAVVYHSANGYTFSRSHEFTKEKTGFMWECPDLFSLNQQWLLIFSAMKVEGYQAENVTFIAPVDFNYEKADTAVHDYELMDYGADFYAPQTMEDPRGRRIVIAWLRMEKPLNEDAKWVGTMTLPREIFFTEEKIYYRVIDDILKNKLAINPKEEVSKQKNGIDSLNLIYHLKKREVYEVKIEFDVSKDFYLCYGKENELEVTYSHAKRQVAVSRKNAEGSKDIYLSPVLNEKIVSLQILLDESVAEVFINEGRYVISTVIYKKETGGRLLISDAKELNMYEVSKLDV